MCGIAGIAGDALEPCSQERIARMKAALVRRGPDSDGTAYWPSAILGHRRLSIFDTSAAGTQPMRSRDGNIGVVFNGSIYNFKDLRRELEQAGYRFYSQTDTEVLIHGYEYWGVDSLVSKLRGMFAFAVWDDREKRLVLVRDRLGVKPLIYTARKNSIAFASTVDALQEGGYLTDIDERAVLDYLESGWVPDHHCIFRDAVKVPAATIVEWSQGKLSQRLYWKVPPVSSAAKIGFAEAVCKTEQLLLEAVQVRLSADVPVGALLSGGIDSGLVCWAMSRLGAKIQAFTIRTAGQESDESAQARQTAKLLGISHELIDLPPSEGDPITELISAYGEPFASASGLGMLRLSRAVKPKVTVLLTGDGGDDIFLGYPRHKHMLLAQRISQLLPNSVAAMWPGIRRVIKGAPQLRRPMHLLDYAIEGLAAASANADALLYYQRFGLLSSRLEAALDRRKIPSGSVTSAKSLLREFLEHEWRNQFVGEYMTKVDGSTMFHGIEARSPFLDHHLWEFAASLPYSVRLHRGRLKAVLREIVRKRIGPEIANRRKRGFTIPVDKWLTNEWKAELQCLNETSLLVQNKWINRDAIRAAAHQALATKRVPAQLWRLIVLERWMKQKQLKLPFAISA